MFNVRPSIFLKNGNDVENHRALVSAWMDMRSALRERDMGYLNINWAVCDGR